MSEMRTPELPKTPQYEAVEFLGEGLNSRVYRGFRKTHQNLPAQEVAIKIFKKSREVLDFEHRFQKLVKVRSRYCVGLLGWELIGDQVSIIMDYVPGISVNELMNKTVLTSAQKNEVLAQLQTALGELHSFDVVHGDLSGANMMIDESGQLRLIDYGFGQMQSNGEVVGSPRFLSPQRWKGEPANQRDDQFSFQLLAEDIKTNSLNKKESFNSLQKRSEALHQSYLSTSGHYFENGKVKNEIAEIVQQLIALNRCGNNNLSIATLALKTKTVVIQKLSFLEKTWAYGAIVFTVFITVFIFPTLSGGSFLSERAVKNVQMSSIEFRTQQWFEIEINGRYLGYTPLKTQTLLPGLYKLKWKSQGREGIVSLELSQNAHLVLKDRDFK